VEKQVCIENDFIGIKNNINALLRLKGAQRNTDVWQRILKVRSLAVTPKEDMEMWIKFANLCRKSGRLSLAQKTLLTLVSPSSAALATSPELPADFDISVRFYSCLCI
jgi:hypothetical protein